MTMYNVSYRYVNPHGAGPFRGKMKTEQKHAKGDIIRAMFGLAEVKTCSKCREPREKT